MTAQSMLAETARAGDWLLATYALDLPAADTTAALTGTVSYHATIAFQRSTSGPPCRSC